MDAANRRVVTVEVTETGRQAMAQVLSRRRADLRAVLDRMPVEQRHAAGVAAHHFAAAAATVAKVSRGGAGR